ncbi:unnamed protein product [Blepharisma stoltei]|uniref:Phosphoglycolate phosphatase n=1 Tax=Blepharisma stoltei TaxID=1481888 RepID=A0AAU9J7L4_9CILI|nr:unnamed protein product [Blepharisma stoltei]
MNIGIYKKVLSRAPKTQIYEILSEIDTIISDCDGVMYAGTRSLPYVQETYKLLRDMGKQFFFYSNSSTKTRKDISLKLESIGIKTEVKNVFTASYVMAHYVANYHPYIKKVYAIGEEGLYHDLREKGINVIEGNQHNHGILKWDFLNEIHMDDDIGAIVMGYDANFNYLKLAITGVLLSRPQCLFLATNSDDYDLIDGHKHPETGAFIASIEEFTKRSPDVVVGKPNPIMFNILRERHPEIRPEKTLMIGDRLDTDMSFARNSGLKKMLTFSGVTQVKELESLLPTDIDYFIHYLGMLYEGLKL